MNERRAEHGRRSVVVVWLALAASGANAAGVAAERGVTGQVLQVNVAGIGSWDQVQSPANEVQFIDLAALAGMAPGTPITVTSIGWNVTGEAFGTSWASDMGFYLDDNIAPDLDGVVIRPLVKFDFPGQFSFDTMDQADLTDNGVQNLVLPNGILRLEAYEVFDDAPGIVDGLWQSGMLFIGISTEGEPGAAADDANDATLITGEGVFPFDNTNATTDGNSHFQCAPTGSAQVHKDVWWRWISTITGAVELSTCGMTMVDARVVVYGGGIGGTPGSGAVIACDLGCDGVGGVTFYAREGQEYLIRLGVGPEDRLRGQGIGGEGSILLGAGDVPLCFDGDCQALGVTTTAYVSDNVTFRTADNWIAPASGTIGSLCFWAPYDDATPTGISDGFRVVYYKDAGGRPGQAIGEFMEASLALTASRLGIIAKSSTLLTDVNSRVVFEFSGCHAPVPVTAGETYWIEITNSCDASGPWGWARAGSAGDGALQDSTVGTSYSGATNRPDMAVCVGFVGGCALDANGDGDINFADLNLIVSDMNSACP